MFCVLTSQEQALALRKLNNNILLYFPTIYCHIIIISLKTRLKVGCQNGMEHPYEILSEA